VENRRRLSDHSPEYSEMESIATKAATKALENLFEIFGADITSPEGRKTVRDNWAWLTDTRIGTQFIRRTSWGAAIAAIMGSILAGLAWAVSKGIAAIAAGIQVAR